MAKIKVNELSKTLGIKSAELVELLQKAGSTVKIEVVPEEGYEYKMLERTVNIDVDKIKQEKRNGM